MRAAWKLASQVLNSFHIRRFHHHHHHHHHHTPPLPSPTTTSRLNDPRARSRARPRPRRHAEFCQIDPADHGHAQSPGLTARRSLAVPHLHLSDHIPQFIRLSVRLSLCLSVCTSSLLAQTSPHLTSPPRPLALGTLPPPSIRPGPGHKSRIPRCMRLARATTSSHPSAPSAHPRRPCEVCRPAPDHDMLYQPYFTSTLRPDGIAATRRPSWILYTSPNSLQSDISRN
jgi:hypothetical protein